jgi:DUF4097 and DUF4098 domain-containing protein YvlB
MKKIFVYAAVLAFVACVNYNYNYQAKETHAFSATLYDSLQIDTENGEVQAWVSTDSLVSMQITKRVSGRDQADAEAHISDITITTTEDTIHRWLFVKAEMPSGVGRSYGADFAVSLPERFGCHFISSNGAINVTGVKGPLTLATSNGEVGIEDGQGPVVITTSNGEISALYHTGGLAATTSNGKINTDIVSLKNNDIVDLHSSNGEIVLSLPDSISASIEAQTSNGHISATGFPITIEKLTDTYLKGTIGSGAATIKLTTSNGNIRIMKR